MGTILDQIVETKRREVNQARLRRPVEDLKSALADQTKPRDFYAAVSSLPTRGINLIAEIKKKSPSAGLIRPDFDPVALAKTYETGGANALSVLTDEPYFAGRIEFIQQIRQAVPLPILRKDFMVDPYQIYESRAAGADAVLLIGEVLDTRLLREMRDLACELGMTSLIEVHEAATLAAIQETIDFSNNKRSLLGINNRNLRIQQTDLSTTETLARQAKPETVLVSESGIKTRADVEQMIRAGARALLIGETFMRAPDILAKMEELLGPVNT